VFTHSSHSVRKQPIKPRSDRQTGPEAHAPHGAPRPERSGKAATAWGHILIEKEKRRRRYSPYCGASVSSDNEVKGHSTSQQRMYCDGHLTGAIYVLKSVTKMSGNP